MSIYVAYYLGKKNENPKASFLDQLICLVTKSRFSHVELIYDWSDVSKRGRCFSSSPRDGGVRGNTIDFGSGRWEVYEVETTLTSDQCVEWFMPKLNAKYDWLGAVGAAIPIFNESSKRWFCSEIVLTALGYPRPWRYSPQEMFELLKESQKRIL